MDEDEDEDEDRGMLTDIEYLIHARTIESTRIDYKSYWNPAKVLCSICAFANDIDNMGEDT